MPTATSIDAVFEFTIKLLQLLPGVVFALHVEIASASSLNGNNNALNTAAADKIFNNLRVIPTPINPTQHNAR